MLVLLAAVATGAVATTVTWVTTDFYNTSPDTFTKYDVTVTTTNQARMSNFFYGNGVNTFTTTLGNFTKIEIVFKPSSSPLTFSGWDYEVIEANQINPNHPEQVQYTSKLTWTGDAESVSIQGLVEFIKSITFTIGEPATGYSVSLKEGTEDATSWQGKAGEGEYQALPLEGVAANTTVSVKYNGTKKVKSVKAVKKAAPAYALVSVATTSDCGKVVCAAGHLHDAKTAVPAGCTAVGILGKVTETGHGLILALKNAYPQNWNTINGWTSVDTYAGTTLKVLPDGARCSLTSYTALGEIAVSNWAVAQKSDYEAIFINLGSTAGDEYGTTYDANVIAYITGAGGTALEDYWYWSATEYDDECAWNFNGTWWNWEDYKDYPVNVRPVLGF